MCIDLNVCVLQYGKCLTTHVTAKLHTQSSAGIFMIMVKNNGTNNNGPYRSATSISYRQITQPHTWRKNFNDQIII